jgi:NAD(P)-dependent dehydrogenase (short-subunit alcohol dehydrogenase family)
MIPPIQNMKDAFSVAGMNVVITGGGRGIGYGISTAYAQSGANVAILARNIDKAQKTVEELSAYGGNHFCVECDVTSLDSVKAATDAVYRKFGHVDVLVNNAGISLQSTLLKDKDLEKWHKVIDTDLHGPVNMIYCMAPKMIEAGRGGSIINISSIGSINCSNAKDQPMPPYFTAKAALNQFTRYMSVELGPHNIRINCIAPGMTHSDLDSGLAQSMLDLVSTKLPMGRFGEPIEIGALCIYLSSHAGCHVTGSIYVHDGGLLVVK